MGWTGLWGAVQLHPDWLMPLMGPRSPCRHWGHPRRRWGPADVCNRKAQTHHSGDGRTDWCRMTLSLWDSGLRVLLFWNTLSRVDCLLAQRRRDCFVLWLRLFPKALSFPHRVSSTNAISFTHLLLYFNPTSSLGIISPLSLRRWVERFLNHERLMALLTLKISTLLFNSAPQAPMRLWSCSEWAPWKVIFHFLQQQQAGFLIFKKKIKCIHLKDFYSSWPNADLSSLIIQVTLLNRWFYNNIIRTH